MTCRDYLLIDQFLKTELDARVLKMALEIGLIDALTSGGCSFNQIPIRNTLGRQTLVDLLLANEVVVTSGAEVALTPVFRSALDFRDLLEAKIAFATEVAHDISRLFPLLIDDLPSFMDSSVTFQMFRYDRCFEATVANLAATRHWMEYTTALTRYEGRVLAEHVDLQEVHRLLDVGGNSGELALQFCILRPNLTVTVFDLPVVCEIGRGHVEARGSHSDITFVSGDLRRDPLPGSMDAVTLKSLLHDWPEEDAVAIIEKAAAALRPGGKIVIFERGPLTPARGVPFAQFPNFVFFHFFRPADLYLRTLHALGFDAIGCETIPLETEFNLITARRPVR